MSIARKSNRGSERVILVQSLLGARFRVVNLFIVHSLD